MTLRFESQPYTLNDLKNMPATTTRDRERLGKEVALWLEKPHLTAEEMATVADVLARRVIQVGSRLLSNTGSLHYSIYTLLQREELTTASAERVLGVWASSFADDLRYSLQNKPKITDGIWLNQQRLLGEIADFLEKETASLPLLGTVWRAVRMVAPDEEPLAFLTRKILRNPHVTPSLAAVFALDSEDGLLQWEFREQQDRAIFHDIGDLPTRMFLQVVGSLPLPAGWLVNLGGLRLPAHHQVAPGLLPDAPQVTQAF